MWYAGNAMRARGFNHGVNLFDLNLNVCDLYSVPDDNADVVV